MRLILAQYLQTLRERDEFDRLLPELLSSMGYVPLSKPQAGIRQFGVDFAAVGKAPQDGVDEILLFVIKRGNIGRREWCASEPADLRPSLNDVLDVYLPTHIAPEHEHRRKVIVVATTGELKQEITLDWAQFTKANEHKASFHFWDSAEVAALLEAHLLDETLFADEDRRDLRKSLALAGDRDYGFGDFVNLLRRQLGLAADGSVAGTPAKATGLAKAIRRVNLAAQVCAHWALAEGNSQQALWVSERTLLWTWHRLQQCEKKEKESLYEPFAELWDAYLRFGHRYFETMLAHFITPDGMSGYCRENAEFSLVLFEHIGILATLGISQLAAQPTSEEDKLRKQNNAEAIADVLCAVIDNNSASGSPRLDRNVTDITLALVLMMFTGHQKEADEWLRSLGVRLNFSFMRKQLFPICTDSVEDLVDLEVNGDSETADRLMSSSWMLASVSAWCALRHVDNVYRALASGASNEYSNICAQLWHPAEEWWTHWFFQNVTSEHGHSEAPYMLPIDPAELIARIDSFQEIESYHWAAKSPSVIAGIWPLDFIACRHFQMPVPASLWYVAAAKGGDIVEQLPSRS